MTAISTIWGPASLGAWRTDYLRSLFNLNDADNSVAQVFPMIKDGTIDTLRVAVGGIVGNPPAYNVGLVTVDSSGFPTTTAYGGSAVESYDFTVTGIISVTLTTPATAAAGDVAALRIWPTASAPDVSNYVRIYYNTMCGYVPYRITYYTTGWVSAAGASDLGALEYDTGEINGLSVTDIATTGFDSADTPDEVGCKFTLPFTAKCRGARIGIALENSNTSYTVKLYDDADSVLASCDISDEDFYNHTMSTIGSKEYYWDEITLYAGRTYRLTVLATHATSTIFLGQPAFNDSAARNFVPEGNRWQKTVRTDGGAWTDSDYSLPYMGLQLTDVAFQRASGFAA